MPSSPKFAVGDRIRVRPVTNNSGATLGGRTGTVEAVTRNNGPQCLVLLDGGNRWWYDVEEIERWEDSNDQGRG